VRKLFLKEAEGAGVTWLIKNVYPLRHIEAQAFRMIDKGPPTP
jgi:hypothetical protein